jgi:hypothetical protein
VESQAPVQLSSYASLGRLRLHPDLQLDNYEIAALFNDVYWHEHDSESFPRSKDQANPSTTTKMTTTAGDIVRIFSRFLGYLLRSLLNWHHADTS